MFLPPAPLENFTSPGKKSAYAHGLIVKVMLFYIRLKVNKIKNGYDAGTINWLNFTTFPQVPINKI